MTAQSDAILWFLAEWTSFLPEDAFDRAQVAQWLFFEQERVMSGIGGARFRILTGRNPELVPAKLELARTALEMLEAHFKRCSFLVGSSCSIADLANFAYTHVAHDAGFSMSDYPAVGAWLERVATLPRFVDDLTAYPDNARRDCSKSIYDA